MKKIFNTFSKMSKQEKTAITIAGAIGIFGVGMATAAYGIMKAGGVR